MLCRWQDFTLYGGLSDVPGLPGGSAVKNAPAKITDMKNKRYNFKKRESVHLQCRRCGFNPWVGKSPGERHGNPPKYSCLGNPIDRGASVIQSVGLEESRQN